MSRAAVSLFVFGIYLLVLGIVLLTVPNLFLAVFGLPPTTDVWIRVVGMLVDILGFYYVCAARAELQAFFEWTVSARMAFRAAVSSAGEAYSTRCNIRYQASTVAI